MRVPPRRYGGTERVVHALTEELVRRGHDVTLFAAGTSITSARLHSGSPLPLWDMGVADALAYRVLQLEDVVRHSAGFDVIHSHVDYLPWLAGERLQAPLVTTLHGPLDRPELTPIFEAYRDQPLVSISDSQRKPVAGLGLRWMGTVYHGLEPSTRSRLGAGDGGYLAFLGRINREKDPVTAIRVAIRAGIPIKIAARVDPVDEVYHRECVVPLLDHPLVEWIGEVDEDAKAALLSEARALLVPIAWEEPFGLVFIEALAAGTPVITRPRGSTPELLRHGEHGFLVESEDGLVAACRAVGTIDRVACRAWALQRFSRQRMADDYEHVYSAATTRRPAQPLAQPAVPRRTAVSTFRESCATVGGAMAIPLAVAGVEPPHPLPPADRPPVRGGGKIASISEVSSSHQQGLRMGLETPETKRVVIAEPEPLHIPRPQPAQEPKPEPVKVPA